MSREKQLQAEVERLQADNKRLAEELQEKRRKAERDERQKLIENRREQELRTLRHYGGF